MSYVMLLFVPSLAAGGLASSTQPDSIDACGWFEEFPAGCVLFYSSMDDGCPHVRSDLGTLPDSIPEFQMVRVRARLTWQRWCEDYEDYVITDPVITACPPVDLGCGVLCYDDVDQCHTWSSPTHHALSITSLQGFALGDTVRAIGTIDWCMPTFCSDRPLVNYTFSPCKSPPAVEHDTWGSIKVLFK
jgi:hypothetical protein